MAMSINQKKNTQNKPKCPFCNMKGHNEEKCWKKHLNLKPNKAKNNQNSQNGAKK
jgi:hypothetical protein